MANDISEIDRRFFLAGTGAAFAAPLLSTSVPTRAHSGHGVSVFGKSGNFDLDNPRDRLLARIKINASLTGKRVYLWNMSRHMFCEPGKPPYQILAELEAMTIWIDAPEEGATAGKIGALFTRTPVDPATFEPISSYDNPYTGKTVKLEDTLFGGNGFPVDPEVAEPNIVFQQHRPHYRMGDEFSIVNFDPDKEPGEHQPKVDSAVLTANYADVMDPSTGSADCNYSFAANFPADRYRWADVAKGDPSKIFTLKVGKKVSSLNDVPPEFQRTLIAQYPERF
ncbi:hypothetical protein [Altererythrobacter sp. GH1-8]|uniref:hypothetical protein n=1 Tax=Altererythrobacter sp. GH1-8 TaxID=3349333 RepID=UPI00374D8FAC